MISGTLYDGATAYPHRVAVTSEGGSLQLRTDDGYALDVDVSLLTRDGEGSDHRFGRRDLPGWRLRLDGPPPPALAALLPGAQRYGRWIDRIGLGKAAVAFAAITGAVLAVGYAAPGWLAPHVPLGWERNLGAALVGDFGENRCRSQAGQRALETLAERVSPGVTKGERAISFAALDIGMINAAAVPGQNVIFFRGMLDDARSPDELAGVVAHEIAHVRRRHVTEALIRELGIGALIRLFAGGIGANAEQLLSLSFTREHEAEADADALAMLKAAGIDPRPTATLFERLGSGKGRMESRLEWLESHPDPQGRAKSFREAHEPRASYRSSLSTAEFEALKAACRP